MFTKTQNKRLKNRLFIVVFLLVIGSIYLAQNWLAQNIVEGEQCDVSTTPCELALGNAKLLVAFTSPPRIEERSKIKISGLKGVKVKQVTIRGVNMYMGQIPVVEESSENNAWMGWTFLGACTEPNMIWEIAIQLEGEEEQGRLVFKTSVQ